MKQTHLKLVRGLLVVLIFSLGLCSLARAEKLVFTPSLTSQLTYDDNVHYDDEGDFEFRLTPSFKINHGQEDWRLKAGGKVTFFRYADLDVYNRDNYEITAGLEKSFSERLQATIDASYKYDHTFVDELTESGSITDQALRRIYTVSPRFSWRASEKDTLSFQAPLALTKYAGNTNPDSTSKGGVVGWTRILNNEKTSMIWQGSFTNYDFDRIDGETNQNVYTLMGGFSYKPSELIDIKSLLGTGYMHSEVRFDRMPMYNDDKDESFFNLDISGTYSREKWNFTFGADRNVSPSTYGETTLRTRGRISGEYFFTERFSTYLECAYYVTEANGLVTDNKHRTYYFRPWLMYRLSQDSRLKLEYKYTNNKNMKTEKEQDQNRLGIRFEYSYPIFY